MPRTIKQLMQKTSREGANFTVKVSWSEDHGAWFIHTTWSTPGNPGEPAREGAHHRLCSAIEDLPFQMEMTMQHYLNWRKHT